MLTRRRFTKAALAGCALPLWPMTVDSLAAEGDATARAARALGIDDFRRLRWRDAAGAEPLIGPPALSPIIADPALLPAADSPDRRWHLFAHSAFGIHHFHALDPLHWEAPELTCWNGMRPFLLRQHADYALWYEDYPPFALLRSALPAGLRGRWRSWIARRHSSDLDHWSEPRVMLEPALDWQRNALGEAVGNPCVLRIADDGPAAWALYYSGGLRWIPDCGFTEPYAIGRALAPAPEGPWHAEPEPLLAPRADDPAHNLSAGSIKVLRTADGFVGLQNAISWDGARSTSALWLLWSADGRTWQRANAPLLAPGAPPWRRSHVYACDVRYDPAAREWWLFYNARSDWAMGSGREAIGALRAPG